MMKGLMMVAMANAALGVALTYAIEPTVADIELTVRQFEFDPIAGVATIAWDSVEGGSYAIDELGDTQRGWQPTVAMVQGLAGHTELKFYPRSESGGTILFRVRELSSPAPTQSNKDNVSREGVILENLASLPPTQQQSSSPKAMSAGQIRNESSTAARASKGMASLRIEGIVNLVPFKVGTQLWSSTDRYYWTEVPTEFEGFRFTQFDNSYHGITTFSVASTGTVYLAVTSRWGGGGNHSGGWTDELISKESFLAQGWCEVVGLQETADDIGHEHRWVLYSRHCRAGEQFRIRTEKYCNPILFLR